MKVPVYKIPSTGLPVSFSLSRGFMCEELLDEDDFASVMRESLTCDGRLTRFAETDVNLALNVRGTLFPKCFRCLASCSWPLLLPIEMVLLPASQAKGTAKGSMDDLRTGTYKGDTLDLGLIAREQTFLNLPMQYLCSKDCRGICQRCGGNLNHDACQCSQMAGADTTLAQAFRQSKELD